MERPNNKGSHNFLVGLFVAIALLVSAGFIVFMGSSVFGGEYRVNAMFRDVRGLNIGAPVFLSGIQVGRVSSKDFPTEDKLKTFHGDPTNGIVVVLTLYNETKHRVMRDSVATISTQGVLGDKVVVLTPGSPDETYLKPGEWLYTEEPRELGDYFAEGGNLVENLGKVAVQLNVLLDDIIKSNKVTNVLENLNNSARNLNTLLVKLNRGEGSLGGMIAGGENDKLASTLGRLDSILEKIETGEGTLGALVNDPTLHEDLKVLLGGAQRSGTLRFLIRQAIREGEKKQ